MSIKKEKSETKETEESLIELGKFYFINGKYDQAIEEFKKALKINPGSSEIYYNLGLVYEGKNNLEEARKMYEKASEIDPNNKLAMEHLKKIVGL